MHTAAFNLEGKLRVIFPKWQADLIRQGQRQGQLDLFSGFFTILVLLVPNGFLQQKVELRQQMMQDVRLTDICLSRTNQLLRCVFSDISQGDD
ncbi:hypothetical protein SDC9_195769 [bioreactor metagenome]|uniref:Uncharacterized protein n=1 Tax=bioreactor metagenome TaxID=1076179 RepID=A0A645IIM4_9ZZZZ